MSYGTPPPPPGNQPPSGQQPPYGEQPQYGQQQPYGGQQPYGQQPQYGYAAAPAAGDPGTLDLPYYGIGFVPAIKRAFQKYARFDGRASRSEYWFFGLGIGVLYVLLAILLAVGIVAEVTVLWVIAAVLMFALWAACIVPSIAVAVRRLHDGGFSGFMYFVSFIPAVGGIIFLVLMCLPPKPEGARYDRVGGGQGYGQQGYGNPYGQ